MIDLEGVKAFIAVADTRSFSVAAERLHLTQPAVSKRIAQLENQMKVRLFDRIGRTVTLTEAGRKLEPRAKLILTNIEDTHRAISNLNNAVTGQLALATSHHIGLWRLPDILRRYTALYPEVNLDLRFMDSEVAHEQIIQGNLELGIITLAPTPHDRLTSIRLWEDELMFVSAPNHPLSSVTGLTLNALSQYPAILPDMSTFTGRIVKQLFEKEQLSLNVTMSTNYLETIKMLISVGLGWSVLPKTMLDSSLQILELNSVVIHRDLGVIHHIHRTLSNAARAFLELLEREQPNRQKIPI